MNSTERELVGWIFGLIGTVFAVAFGAVHGGWAEALAAGAAGFSALGGVAGYANKPAAPKA